MGLSPPQPASAKRTGVSSNRPKRLNECSGYPLKLTSGGVGYPQMAVGARRRRDNPGSVVLALHEQRLCAAQIVQRVDVGDASGVVQIHKRY